MLQTAFPLLRTKLVKPPVTPDLVPRPALLERLEHGRRHALTLVSTPAGYGKSTLLSHWLDTFSGGAWISLEPYDDDFRTFLTYFLTALGTAAPDAFEESRALVRAGELPPPRHLLAVLLNELESIEGQLVVVLDDYHVIRNHSIHEFMTALIDQHSPSLHMAIAIRRDPPFPLAKLRARGAITELRADSLRFGLTEATGLVNAVAATQFDESDVSVLVDQTEGWPVGLRLAAMSMRDTPNVDRLVQGMRRTNRYVMDYLVDEVLSHQPPGVQRFLLVTSLLDRFSAPLCEAMIEGTEDIEYDMTGEQFMTWVRDANLFSVPLDDQSEWYRYHHLFQDLLSGLLASRSSDEEIAALHRRARDWYREQGLIDEALQHAFAAGDARGAARIVGEHRHPTMNLEEWFRLNRWLGDFDPAVLETEPELLLARAWLLFNKEFDFAPLEQVLAKLEHVLDTSQIDDAHRDQYRAEIDAIRSGLRYWALDGEGAIALARQSLEGLPVGCAFARGVALMHLGGGLQLMGRRAEAVEILNGALVGTPGGGADQASALATLCFVELLSADANALMRAARQLERFSETHALPSSAAFAAYFAGIAHYDRNDLPAAETEFRKAFDARYVTPLHNAAHSGFALAVTVLGLGRHDEAESLVDVISEYVLEARNPYFAAMAEAFRAELDLRHGQPANAARWALGYDPGPLYPDPRFYLPQLTLVRMLLTRPSEENTKRARKLLDRLADHAAKTHNARRALEISIFRVLLLDAEGDEVAALAVLRAAVEVASVGGVIRPFFEHGKRIGELLDRMEREERTDLPLEELTPSSTGALESSPPRDRSRGWASDPSIALPLATPLSNRELDVLGLLAERLSNKEIAGRLFISPDTAKRHTVNIYQKLDVHGRREAVAKALELGILPADSRAR